MVYAVKVVEKLLKSGIVRFVCSHGASGGFAASYGLAGWRLEKTGMTVAIPLMATVISRRNRLLLSARRGKTFDCGILTAQAVTATLANWLGRAQKGHRNWY